MCIFLPSVSSYSCRDRRPDRSLLKDIGTAIVCHDQCVKLALALQLGDDDFYKLVEATFTDDLAYKLLKKWTKAENATGSVLHAALRVAERQDLADRFEKELLGRGKLFLVRPSNVIEIIRPSKYHTHNKETFLKTDKHVAMLTSLLYSVS